MKSLLKKIIPANILSLCLQIGIYFGIKYFRLKYPPFVIRQGTTDSKVFRNIFFGKEFKLPIKINPRLIIDAGAYTGLSTLYYAAKYPSAKIIAVEPELSNFKTLEENTKKLKNVSRTRAGVWHKNTFLKILDRLEGNWSFVTKEVSEKDDYDIKAVTIDGLLKQSGFDCIDILKLDIEGSEIELFSENYKSWLDKVNILVIELHDPFRKGCAEALNAVIKKEDWNEFKNGEKVILIRKDFVK